MSTVETISPTDVVRGIFERLNQHDADGLLSFAAEDEVSYWPVVGRLGSSRAVRDHFAVIFAAMPDFHLDVERLAGDAEAVFVHWHLTGTFTGAPFYGVEATGRRIDLRGTDYFIVRDGKARRNFIAYDGMSFAVQAGILPHPDSRLGRTITAAVNLRTRLRRRLRR